MAPSSQPSNKVAEMAGRALALFDDTTSAFGNSSMMLHDLEDFSMGAAPTSTTEMQNKTAPTSRSKDPSSMPPAKQSHSELQALTLLDGIRQARDAQLKKDQELDQSITAQLELAMARYSMGSSYGTKLSMNKVDRIRSERKRVNSAIDLLELHATQVESKLQEALSMSSSSLPVKHDAADWGTIMTEEAVNLDLTAHESYQEQMRDILSGRHQKILQDDDNAPSF